MKKIIFFILFSNLLFPQEQLWKGYFSYNETVDIASGENKVFASTKNAVFYKNLETQNLETITSINGLKPENISTIYHSDDYNKTFVGNTNGLLLIVNPDGSVSTKVDIINEVPVPPTKKKINHFYEYNGKIYLSCDYGISVLDIATSEFISTYFIGDNGEEIKITQTTVFNNELLALTGGHRIKKASINNPILYDYTQWTYFDANYWNGIITLNNQLIATNLSNITYRLDGNYVYQIFNNYTPAISVKNTTTHCTITTTNAVYVLDTNFSVIATVTEIPNYSEANFISATVVNNELFITTDKYGMFGTSLSNPTSFENNTPDGPLRNYVFRITPSTNKLWAVYGAYSRLYNPYPLDEYGVSYYTSEEGWTTYPYEDIHEAKTIVGATVHPNNPNLVYFSSFFSGILELDNETFTLYDSSNTGTDGLEALNTNPIQDIRVNKTTFDNDNNLWVTNSRTDKPLKVLRANGGWQSYDFSNFINTSIEDYAPFSIDANGTKWIPTLNHGLVAFNEDLNNRFAIINTDSGLPNNEVRCAAIDNDNRLWIGTYTGLRVLSNVNEFLNTTDLSVNNIVIQEGDLAQELFYQQQIHDIAVDGANRKWVSIIDGGVFLISENGKNTIYNFNKNNSPLPSNTINDIEIDGTTGEVFFATDKGLVSFLGTSTKASDNLDNVYVYPNPVRPSYTGTIKIAGLTDKANVKITDIEGNLVHETTTEGGTIEWDGTAFGKHRVASGVYMIFIATNDGLNTKVKKVMIVR